MSTKISKVSLQEILKAIYGDTFVWISPHEVLGICDTNADIKLITTFSIVADYDVYVQWYFRINSDPIINAVMQGYISGIIKIWLPNYHVDEYCFNEKNSYLRFEKNVKQKEN